MQVDHTTDTDTAAELHCDRHVNVTACVIWLHGAGETGKTWRGRLKEGVSRIRMPWVEFVFPDAPAGTGCAWVGVPLPVQPAAADAAAGLEAAVADVHAMLTDLEASRSIDASRVVLGGCGPGAALALLAGRTYSKPLAGIACIGGWLLRPADDAAAAASSARPPVLLCHAEEDDEVPMQLHYAACSWLRKRGHEVTAHQTPTLDLSLPLRRSLSLSLSLSPTLNLSLSLIQP
jgi:phospholipase/carboxylesterase